MRNIFMEWFSFLLLFALCFLLGFLFITSCALPQAVTSSKNNSVFYKKEMQVSVEGMNGFGTMVTTLKPKLHFTFKSSKKIDSFKISTCHKEEVFSDIKDCFWGKCKEYDYIPTDIESKEIVCPMFVESFSAQDASKDSAYIDFQTNDMKLTHHIECNGSSYDSFGVSVCQTKAGLEQRLTFLEEVIFSAPKSGLCANFETTDNKQFMIKPSSGLCVYAFINKAKDKIARVTMVGYDEYKAGN